MWRFIAELSRILDMHLRQFFGSKLTTPCPSLAILCEAWVRLGQAAGSRMSDGRLCHIAIEQYKPHLGHAAGGQ